MRMVIEDDYYKDKELYKEDHSLPEEVLTRFSKVMRKLGDNEEFFLLVENHLTDEKKPDFYFKINNSEKLAGGYCNPNEDLKMVINYEVIMFPEGVGVPSIESAYIIVDLRVERDDKVDKSLRDEVYVRLARTFSEIDFGFISVKAVEGEKIIFES